MWILGPLRQDVCFRCQYRHILRNIEVAPAITPWRQGQRRISSSPLLQHQHALRHPEQQNEGLVGGAVASADTFEYSRHVAHLTAGFRRAQGTVDERYITKHLPLNLNKIALEVNTLGEPASILRLDVNEPKKWDADRHDQRPQEAVQELVPPATISTSDDILESIQKSSITLSPEEVLQSIESVKDRWLAGMDPTAIPSQAQCHDISRLLLRGFTLTQLEQYLNETAMDEAEDFDDLQGLFVGENCTRSRWYSGTSSLERTARTRLLGQSSEHDGWLLSLDRIGRAYGKGRQKLSKKERIVESILRRSWRLRSEEELRTIGELDLRLDKQFWQLLEIRYDLFRQLERRLQVKIQHDSRKDVLRITGTLASCSQAFTALYAPLQTMRNQRLELQEPIRASGDVGISAMGAARLRQSALLADIGAFTRSIITPVDGFDGNLVAFDVLFLAPHKPDHSGLDLLVFDRVARIINMLLSDQSHGEAVFSIPRMIDLEWSQVPLEVDAALPIYQRSTDWIRFSSMPTERQSKTGPTSGVQELKERESMLRVCVQTASDLLSIQESRGIHVLPTEYPSGVWEREPRQSLHMKTGRLAFGVARDADDAHSLQRLRRVNSSLQKVSAHTSIMRVLQKEPKTFIPALPGGIRSFEHLVDMAPKEDQRVALRLKPFAVLSDSTMLLKDKVNLASLPDLTIEVEPIKDMKKLSLVDARFTLKHPSTNILLPFEEADMQFECLTHVDAREPFDESLKRYLDGMVAHDGRVDERTIPMAFELDVPLQACRDYQLLLEKSDLVTSKLTRKKGLQHTRTKQSLGLDPRLKRPSAIDLSDTFPNYYRRLQPLESAAASGAVTKPADANAMFRSDMQFVKVVPEEGSTQAASLRVRYNFVNVEYHSKLRSTFRDYPLTYAIVDAGGIGGQYEELVLEACGPEGPYIPDLVENDGRPSTEQLKQRSMLESAVQELVAEDKRTGRDRAIELKEWFEGRIRSEPWLRWFMPWFATALEVVRGLQ